MGLDRNKTGGRSARIKKNGGGRLPGIWPIMPTRPKIGGSALTQERALTWDNFILGKRLLLEIVRHKI